MIAYLDCPSGLSGDMMLGCLVDAGWSVDALRKTIEQLELPTEEWGVSAEEVMKGPLRATLVHVRAVEGHHHRHLHHIETIINASTLSDSIKQRAIAVFTRLAEAEAKVHGTTVEKIHFHEVGAVDAIIDIVGCVGGLEALGIDKLYASAVPLGGGWADTAHGRIPLPAPATLELVAAARMPTRPALGDGEWLTPTGAALLAECATFTQPTFQIERTGIGAGQRDADWPNAARLMLGKPQNAGDDLLQIETNIDDMNPQFYQSVSDHLFEAGARDVWMTPVQMKKGRPGVVLSVLASAKDEAAITDILLRETTTLGVRVTKLLRRTEAERKIETVQTPFGDVRIKIKSVGGKVVGVMPEYDDCAKLAAAAGATVKQVYEATVAGSRKGVT